MNTHEFYVSLETAMILKEAGFDWECRGYYDRRILRFNFVWDYNRKGRTSTQYSAPTLDVVQRWLREVKGWILEPHYFGEEFFADYEADIESDLLRKYPNKSFYMCYGYFENCMYIEEDGNTYEEALEAGIKKALEIILEK